MTFWKRLALPRYVLLLSLMIVGIFLVVSAMAWSHSATAKPLFSYTPPDSVTVNMDRLDYSLGGSDTGIPCQFDPPDTAWGCTWFDDVHFPQDIRPYPYPTNPITVPIETDYMLDVLSQEMGPAFHPTALRAGAVATRSYVWWLIGNN